MQIYTVSAAVVAALATFVFAQDSQVDDVSISELCGPGDSEPCSISFIEDLGKAYMSCDLGNFTAFASEGEALRLLGDCFCPNDDLQKRLDSCAACVSDNGGTDALSRVVATCDKKTGSASTMKAGPVMGVLAIGVVFAVL